MTAREEIEALLQVRIGLEPASVGRDAIERGIGLRMAACGLSDMDRYLMRLRASREELEELTEEVIVPETWFYRDGEPFVFLSHYVQSEWFPNNRGAWLRVLSVPCATGEEPYSIAMALLDAGLAPADFRIDAVDISRRALLQAQRAVYGANSFRGDDLSFRERYFEAAEGGHRPLPAVRERVRFIHGNLPDGLSPMGAGAYNAIFCRNLLVYFNRPARERTVRTLVRMLREDGLLCVGHSEAGQVPRTHFSPVSHPRAFAFRRRTGGHGRQDSQPDPAAKVCGAPGADRPPRRIGSTHGPPAMEARRASRTAVAMEDRQPDRGADGCWNRIGVSGDGTCPELEAAVHCRNCPVYAAAGRALLEREPPEGYVREQTELLTRQKDGETEVGGISAVVFRLGGEWLALPTHLFREVTETRTIHSLPHRSNDVLLGIVNVEGEIHLCVSIGDLLDLPKEDAAGRGAGHGAYRRMAVVEREGERWIFTVDEIQGVHRFAEAELQDVPATVSGAGAYTVGIVRLPGRNVGYLDDALLFDSLKRRAL